MRYLLQAFVALAALIAAPLLFEPPDESWQVAAVVVAAALLVGLAYRGIVGYVNSRRPRRFHDSTMAPRKPPKPKV